MLLLVILACTSPAPLEPAPPEQAVLRDADLDPRDHSISRSYDEALDVAYPVPEGFTRVDADPVTTWLRARKIGPIFQALLTWRGDPVTHPGRLVRLGLTGHTQLGAASVARLRAEYLRDSGKPVAFHVSKDHTLGWQSHDDWDRYLTELFESVDPDTLRLDTAPATTPHPGDLLVQESGPHAAIIMDVATKGEDVMVLIGEGHVPAQYFHVEHGPYNYWWRWDAEAGVEGLHEPMPASTLRRWKH